MLWRCREMLTILIAVITGMVILSIMGVVILFSKINEEDESEQDWQWEDPESVDYSEEPDNRVYDLEARVENLESRLHDHESALEEVRGMLNI